MRRPIRVLGLVRGRSYDALLEQQNKLDARAHQLTEQLDAARADSKRWKVKAEDAQGALKKAQEGAAAAKSQLQHAEKMRAEESRRARQEHERTADLEALRKRLVDSERELAIAREQLMAIEVKLDILEGAANVLDGRTRLVVRTSGRGDPSPV